MSRNLLIQIKVSEEEKKSVKKDADRAGQNVSEYARSLLLHGRPAIPDAAPTVGPNEPLPARAQGPQGNEAPHQDEDFKRLVAMHYKKTSLPNAERLARKELGMGEG